MDSVTYISLVRTIAERWPEIVPHLKGRARWVAFVSNKTLPVYVHSERFIPDKDNPIYLSHFKDDLKSYDYFLQQLERLITTVYSNQLGGEFIDIMANLISGQLTQAFNQAWKDEEGEGNLPPYLSEALEEMILGQYDHVDGLYRDIVDARVDETPIEPLLARAPLWANRWTEAYNEAVHLITLQNGGNEEWVLGATEEHCPTCSALHGIVARASEWDALGVRPQNAPNDILDCGGWKCDCERRPTDKRRSPKAYETILNVVTK